MILLRKANEDDLAGINQVIETAVMTWNLPERVKRLSLPSYRYNKVDLQHLEIILAEQSGKIVAVAAWEEANKQETPGKKSALLLHGLYVHPDAQHQGIATRLLQAAEQAAYKKGYKGLLVKAQTDAIPFFKKMGMQPIEVKDQSRDYANRFWKSLDT